MTSHDFETEYKKQVTDEVPDLWSRIESGIDALDVQKTPEPKVVAMPTKVNKINRIVKYGSVFAAAACVLIVMVAVLNNSSKDSATEQAINMKAMAAAEAEETVATDEAVAVGETAVTDEAVAAGETAVTDEAVAAEANMAAETEEATGIKRVKEAAKTVDSFAKSVMGDYEDCEEAVRSDTEEMSEQFTINAIVNEDICYMDVTDEFGNSCSLYVPDDMTEAVSSYKEGDILTADIEEITTDLGDEYAFIEYQIKKIK